ncbi:hypothetical protein Pmar_PMAR005521 [Perkinsus marinus ATCC 50983]|uniref:Uncharacterized protein n=1 Tax=Perkinsus marinus (strain ATCC 50983 / TXsc) TaxID=423536 RepID=C5K5H4_PERM5|nr:hypothetical protein Pmar_PMAR005521 [Perkinsus marinus ATCC 50983]EER20269.1 hypothetical protein Pmar_PMAR005521 [Perkinsus marinus ATCC 50983]|eukprot:XP_002788473.1 hypothetical protein Pmar_PMAR005521 [Perkinsus marinus ATCC 50983]
MRVTKLILRVLHPQFPPGVSSSDRLWYPDGDVTKSIMYTELLTKLGGTSVREVFMLPYVFDEVSREGWLSIAPTKGKVMSGVFHLLKEYNAKLSSIQFSGITVDYEEMKHVPTEYDLFWDPQGEADFKDGTNFEVGVAIGFDQVGRFEEWPWVNNLYLEMYDFFRPTAYISQTANSRFLLYKNKASKMVNYVVNEAVDKVVQAAYADHRSRAHLMWSLQHQDDGCVYPLNSGKCGYNNEFGSWNPAPFNEFLHLIKSRLPHKSQGVYHYDFLPYSMIPEDMHQCLSNGCS